MNSLGLYYPPDSLKTRLCLRGRQMLYSYCDKNSVPYRKAGKLVVAHEEQIPYIKSLHHKAAQLKPPPRWESNDTILPTEMLDGASARKLEPALSESITAALFSSETGIIDSHSLMESFERDIEDAGGALAYATSVVRIDPSETEAGWVVQTVTGEGSQVETDAMLARVLVNASGLAAPQVLNSILPPKLRLPMYFARGSYASYKGPGIEGISHLIYPCPDTTKSKDAHGFQSLGTHLTLDLEGKIRFGPDLEWLSPPVDKDDESAVDFWMNHLIPDDSRLHVMHTAVTRYIPGVVFSGLQPDYVGIRPKLVGSGGGFQDFLFRTDMSDDFISKGVKATGGPMISLLGIESPGLTSSMAIAEAVVEDLLVANKLNMHV
jgi:2-hydroxyglutarate dehydrogenase